MSRMQIVVEVWLVVLCVGCGPESYVKVRHESEKYTPIYTIYEIDVAYDHAARTTSYFTGGDNRHNAKPAIYRGSWVPARWYAVFHCPHGKGVDKSFRLVYRSEKQPGGTDGTLYVVYELTDVDWSRSDTYVRGSGVGPRRLFRFVSGEEPGELSAEKLGMEPVPRAHVEFRFKRPVTHENGFLPFAPPRGALQLMDCPQDD